MIIPKACSVLYTRVLRPLSSTVAVYKCKHNIHYTQHASNTKPPKYNSNPRVRLHHQDNWKTAHEYMKGVGINMYGIEPAGEYVRHAVPST